MREPDGGYDRTAGNGADGRTGGAPLPRVTHTRTPIYGTRAAHKGLIPPLCAALCFLIPSLVCDIEGDEGRAFSNSKSMLTDFLHNMLFSNE